MCGIWSSLEETFEFRDCAIITRSGGGGGGGGAEELEGGIT